MSYKRNLIWKKGKSASGGLAVYENGMRPIALICSDPDYTKSEMKYHQNLIAAAPQLLEACRYASVLLEREEYRLGYNKPTDFPKPPFIKVLKELRAALAAASESE